MTDSLRSLAGLVLTFVTLVWSQTSLATIAVKMKSMKDATHIEITGLSEWRYDLRRDPKNDTYRTTIQFTGVKPEEVAALNSLRDRRVKYVEVIEGINGDALVEFRLSNNDIGMFDYQTESPTTLVLDIYREEPVKKFEAPGPSHIKGELATLVSKARPKKLQKRKLASIENPEIGTQGQLPLKQTPNQNLKIKYGIFDGGDQDLNRFKIEDKDIDELAVIRSQENIYLHFPELNIDHSYLKDLLAQPAGYGVPEREDDENLQVRLIFKFKNEGKPALGLRTLKFFRDKYRTSQYDKVLNFLEADIYFDLWRRDHERVDFEKAMTKYKALLNQYPNDPSRFKILMLLGLNYLDVGNNFGALSTFQVGIKTYPESPYYWQMRVAVAEAYRALGKNEEAIKEFEGIENDKASGNYGIESRFRRGDVFFRVGDYATSVKEYDEALKKYPDKWAEAANIYFNSAEARFWLKNYKESLEGYRIFLQRFPSHAFGGYAMTRIGEILDILGLPVKRVTGAYLESVFRYRGSPGAYLAKLHLDLMRFVEMKPKELETALKDAKENMPKDKLADVETLLVLNESDGFYKKKNYEKSLDQLIKYYQNNPISQYLPIFKNRIVKNLTAQVAAANEKSEFIKALETFNNQKDAWLSKNNRIDTRYYAALAYENLNILDEAATGYRDCLRSRQEVKDENLKKAMATENLPSEDEINLRLAKVSLLSGEVKKSSEYLNSIQDPNKLNEKNQIERSLILASIAEKEEKLDIAMLALNELTEHWKGSPALLAEHWLMLAKLNHELKNNEKAIGWLSKIIDIAVKTPDVIKKNIVAEALELEGDLYEKRGQYGFAEKSYKLLIDKFGDGLPVASIKYKLGKIYFDQTQIKEAEKIWKTLKDEIDGSLWAKMADEQLAQVQWSEKYKRYVDRKPAGGTK